MLLSYKIVEEGNVVFNEDADLNYLMCISFRDIKYKNSLNFEPTTLKVSVRNFLNHSIASIEQRLKVTGLFRLNESYIFNEHVCFSITKSALEEDPAFLKPINEFLRIYGTRGILFIYSKEKQPNFYERAFISGPTSRRCSARTTF